MRRSYIFWMGIASILGMAKLLAIAQIVTAADFGHYAAAMGTGGLLTALFSFGLIEGTIKRFPRLWTNGKPAEIVGSARTIARRVSLWSLPFIGVGIGAGFLIDGVQGALFGLYVGALGVLALHARIVSAMNVSIGEERLIQSFSLFRATSAAFLVLAGAIGWGWQGGILGEIGGLILTNAQGLFAIRRHLPLGAPASAAETDGHLYLSTLTTNAMGMGDRPLVAALAGPTIAGSYAFAMIVAQIGQVFVNIISQKVGPDLVRHSWQGIPRPLFKAGALTALVTLAAFLAGLVALQVPYSAAVAERYAFSLPELAIGCVACFTHFYVTMEFAVVARDQERMVATASIIAVILFGLGCLAAFLTQSPALAYLSAFVVARVAQLLVLTATISR